MRAIQSGTSTLPSSHGESHQRLVLVAAWWEAKVFTGAERTALELTEEATHIADEADGVPDEVWQKAPKHCDEDQLVALISTIALINAANRMNVMAQVPTGEYEPGQFA